MGFFDRFKKPAPEQNPGPDPPADGEIVTYDHAEQIGSIQLDSGATVGFSLEDCVDFHPNIGAPVVVHQVEQASGGASSIRVALGDASRELEAIHAAAVGGERAVGPSLALTSPEEAAAAGPASLLLSDPIKSVKGLRRWLEACVPNAAIVGESEPTLKFEGLEVRLLVGVEPMSLADYSELGTDFERGAGFVTVVIEPPPAPTPGEDVWSERGRMWSLTRLVALLARGATGVVIHAAGHRVHTSGAWRRRLSDHQPMDVWTAFAVGGHGDTLALVGMGVVGLPDVETVLTADSGVGKNALREAARQMMHEGRSFGFRDTLTVQSGDERHEFEVVFSSPTRLAIAPTSA